MSAEIINLADYRKQKAETKPVNSNLSVVEEFGTFYAGLQNEYGFLVLGSGETRQEALDDAAKAM